TTRRERIRRSARTRWGGAFAVASPRIASRSPCLTDHGPAMSTSGDSIQTRLVRVRGRVQGVGYRHACVQQARALGVSGWVRNRMDDSVEALLQGTPEQLARMCEWMREDMPAALV